MGEGLSNSNKQGTNCAQDGESQFTIEKVKVKKTKTDGYRCINGTYSLWDNERLIYSNICW